MSMLKKVFIFVCLLTFVLLASAGTYGYLRYRELFVPLRTEAKPQLYLLRKGTSFRRMLWELQAAGLVRDAQALALYARFKKISPKIQVGEYEVSAAMTPIALLDHILSGQQKTYSLTIPEGYNLSQIGHLFEWQQICAYDTFMNMVKDPSQLKELGLSGTTMEGYLFPDTYVYTRMTPLSAIITLMVKNFFQHYDTRLAAAATALGMSREQVVTLASIIEKETGLNSERPLISAVFHNRLGKGMRLQTDPTVIYGLGENFDGNLTKAHLTTPTPYNTYTIPGLPPGPIANPGQASLDAALHPAQVDFLYFVAKGDGSHVFTTNYADHTKAVIQYQLKGKALTPGK